MKLHDESSTDASHGDAQADILGGTTIIMMIMFLGIAALMITLLVLLKVTDTELDAMKAHVRSLTERIEILQNKREAVLQPQPSPLQIRVKLTHAVGQIDKLKQESAEQQKEMDKLKAENNSLKEKRSPNEYVSAGMKIWVKSPHRAVITDVRANPDGSWNKQYECHRESERLLPAPPGVPTAQDYMLIR